MGAAHTRTARAKQRCCRCTASSTNCTKRDVHFQKLARIGALLRTLHLCCNARAASPSISAGTSTLLNPNPNPNPKAHFYSGRRQHMESAPASHCNARILRRTNAPDQRSAASFLPKSHPRPASFGKRRNSAPHTNGACIGMCSRAPRRGHGQHTRHGASGSCGCGLLYNICQARGMHRPTLSTKCNERQSVSGQGMCAPQTCAQGGGGHHAYSSCSRPCQNPNGCCALCSQLLCGSKCTVRAMNLPLPHGFGGSETFSPFACGSGGSPARCGHASEPRACSRFPWLECGAPQAA